MWSVLLADRLGIFLPGARRRAPTGAWGLVDSDIRGHGRDRCCSLFFGVTIYEGHSRSGFWLVPALLGLGVLLYGVFAPPALGASLSVLRDELELQGSLLRRPGERWREGTGVHRSREGWGDRAKPVCVSHCACR